MKIAMPIPAGTYQAQLIFAQPDKSRVSDRLFCQLTYQVSSGDWVGWEFFLLLPAEVTGPSRWDEVAAAHGVEGVRVIDTDSLIGDEVLLTVAREGLAPQVKKILPLRPQRSRKTN